MDSKVTEKQWNIQEPGRIEDYNKKLPVLEIYTCVQSEGSRQGRPTVAIRVTGCTHRCWFGEGGWCDSWYTRNFRCICNQSVKTVVLIERSYISITTSQII